MTRGFSPKPRLRFGPALGLGVPSLGELMDIDLEHIAPGLRSWETGDAARIELPADEVAERLRSRRAGLNALTRSLAIEVAARGVRVNAVAPGATRTPMHASGTHDLLAKIHPIGRMGEVQDIVDAVLYLESASFVTGEILHVDGGQAAGVG